MNAFDVISGFIPLLVIGLLTLGVVRLARRAQGGEPVDAAALTRQIVLYGLLFLAMVLTATGVSWLFNELGDDSFRRSNQQLAQAMALVALGAPVFLALLAYVDRRLTRDEDERQSIAWSTYLTIASITSLIGTMVGVFQIVMASIDTSPDSDLEARSVVLALIWGVFFLTHWAVLRHRHGIRGDIHLAAGSIVGLVPLAIGQAGLLTILATRVYDGLLDRPIGEVRNDSAPWAALFFVGCAVWIAIWLREYESAPRTEPWYVTVLPVGTLAGFFALLTTSSWFVYLGLVWFVGETRGVSASDHFDDVPVLIGIGLTGASAWLYHRSLLSGETTRTHAVRSYDYLLMGASLVTGVIGAVMVISSLLDRESTDQNVALAGITLLIVGGVTWSRLATRIVAHQTDVDGIAELTSPVRRSYLYATLGIGGLTALGAGISALEGIFEDVLDSAVDLDTIVDQREQLAIVVIVGAVLWFHGMVLRGDQRRLATIMPPPPQAHWPSRIIVLGSASGQAIDVSDHPGTSVEYWHRTDHPTNAATLDIDELDEALASQPGDDVLVLLNGDTPTVIPFER